MHFIIQALSIGVCAVLATGASVTTDLGEKTSHLIRKEIKRVGDGSAGQVPMPTPSPAAVNGDVGNEHHDDQPGHLWMGNGPVDCDDGEWYSKVYGETSANGPWCEQGCFHVGGVDDQEDENLVAIAGLTHGACEFETYCPPGAGADQCAPYTVWHHNVEPYFHAKRPHIETSMATFHPTRTFQYSTTTTHDYSGCNIEHSIKGSGDDAICQSMCLGHGQSEGQDNTQRMEKHGFQPHDCNQPDAHNLCTYDVSGTPTQAECQWKYVGSHMMSIFGYVGEHENN